MTTPPMIPIDPNNFKTPKSNNNSIVKAWGPAPPARKYRKKKVKYYKYKQGGGGGGGWG